MATFITTIKFTQQGIQAIGESTKRAASFKAAAKKLGVKVVNTYWTLGAYDGLLILEAADEESVTAALLQLAMLGNVQTTTARAFEANEMSAIVAKLSA
jgi:uncharacterized protein with GYD domain